MDDKEETGIYDSVFEGGRHEGVFNLHYRASHYYQLLKCVNRMLKKYDVKRVLEVGCGTGAFSQMLLEKTDISYRGFDFSPVAVEKAINRTGDGGLYYISDATKSISYEEEYDCIVCMEVLEHIDNDVDVISNWRSGARFICSVPNFDDETHVRIFESEDDVIDRYGAILDIEIIRRVKKPAISNISAKSYYQAIKWNRYRPKRLVQILGFSSFASGGWFIFSGKKK